MSSSIDKVKGIIAAAEPNLAGKDVFYNVSAQLSREQKFYSLISDPFTGKPVTNIQELNQLINQLDESSEYAFGALLPSGSQNGGKVERILSQKYNLKATSKTRFTEAEQTRVKEILNEIADEALKVLSTDDQFINNIGEQAESKFLMNLVTAMNGISIKSDFMTIFMSAAQARYSSINSRIYDKLNIDSFPKNIKIVDIVSNIAGKGTTKRRSGTQIIKDENNRVLKVIINPDLNTFSPKAFDAIYKFADELGLLDPRDQEDTALGQGTKSPMDVSSEEWRQDVFQAISEALGGKYKNLLLQDENGQYNALFEKYSIAEEIALGRSMSNLRGFMGELRGILIVDALIPSSKGSGHLMGTAKVTLANSLASESAPVDLIVDLLNEVGRPFGFQIKNTSELSSYSWGNQREKAGMSVPNFYIERLQQVLSQNETNFFGAYVYNQPIDDNPIYQNVYGGFQEAFNNKFIPVYKKLALYIIRQTTEISSGNKLLQGQAINDFFLMNNKIIPASSFYAAMNTENENLIKSSFALQKPDSGYYNYGDNIDEINYGAYVGQAKIKYEIEVKYAQLLQSAYNAS